MYLPEEAHVEQGLHQLSAESGAQRVLAGIRQQVVDGILPPGQRLAETDIMEQFGASRGAVRSALNMLIGEGLVERVLYQGARVRRVSLDEMFELTEVRAAVEGVLAAHAALNATDLDIAQLRKQIHAMQASVERDDHLAYNYLNQDLHRDIHRIADQGAARELALRLRGQSGITHQFKIRRIRGRSLQSCKEHADIVEAIAAHDPPRAELAMRTHLMNLIDAVRMATANLVDGLSGD